MGDVTVKIDVPHLVEIGGEMVEIAEFDCEIDLVSEHDSWAIVAARVDCFTQGRLRVWIDVPKQSPLYTAIVTHARTRCRDHINEAWTDHVTNAGWTQGEKAA